MPGSSLRFLAPCQLSRSKGGRRLRRDRRKPRL